MKIPYLILATTFTLTACGSDTNPPQTSQATPHAIAETPAASTQQETKAKSSLAIQPEKANLEKKKAVQIEEEKFKLPLGRLTGIIDTGEYKQAIINNQNQIIRLKEGENWQGWTVTAIHPEKIAINHEGEEHSLLLLNEFRSPQLTETELANKMSQQEKSQNETVQDTVSDPNTQAFTEEQLTELRSRLLMGR